MAIVGSRRKYAQRIRLFHHFLRVIVLIFELVSDLIELNIWSQLLAKISDKVDNPLNW